MNNILPRQNILIPILLTGLGLLLIAFWHPGLGRGAGASTNTPTPTPLATPTPTSTPTVDSRAKECVRVQHWLIPPTPEPTSTPEPSSTPTPPPSPTLPPSPSPTPSPTTTPTRGPTPDGVHRTARVPILMYHHIDDPPPDDRIRYNLSVPPDHFAAHLQALKEGGYTVITLDDLLYHLTQGKPLPPKPVIITFDDGYEDNYTRAFPLLRKYGMTATFFLITDVVNQRQPGYLTWDMVREMKAAGMHFGAHGRTHIDLAQADVDQLVWQALGSTEVFQVELGEPARYIAYPSGRYDQEVIDVYKSAHYWAGLTTHQGVIQDSDHLFELKRLRVYHDTTGLQLLYLLEMDWQE